MSRTVFAQTIIGKLASAIGTSGQDYGPGSASAAMTAVAEGITEYLMTNTEVEVSYSGIIPGTPPSPDPLVKDTFAITGACAPTGPSDGFDAWIHQIETNIVAGFRLAPSGSQGLTFTQTPFLTPGITTTRAGLTVLHDVGDTDPQLKVWEEVCQGIMDWLNTTALNATPGAAAHPSAASTGTAAIAKITVT